MRECVQRMIELHHINSRKNPKNAAHFKLALLVNANLAHIRTKRAEVND